MKAHRHLHVFVGFIVLTFSTAPSGFSADVTSTWSAAADGNWEDDANWTSVPGPNASPNNGASTYDAVISAAGAPYQVSVSTDIVCQDITLGSADATVGLLAGKLTAVNGISLSAGTLNFLGGTLLDTTVTPTGGNLLISSGILDHSTLGGDLLMDQPGASRVLRLQNGASFTGDLHLGIPDGNTAILTFEQTVTLSGKTLNLDPVYGNSFLALDGDNTLTFASTTTARGAGSIGSSYFVGGTGTLVNQGLITADLAGQTMNINPSIFTNSGTVEAKDEGDIDIQGGDFTNQGLLEAKSGSIFAISSTIWSNKVGHTIRATGPNAMLNFSGSYTNSGTIELTDAILNLGGTFTVGGLGLGGLVRSGDTLVNLTGTLENTGGTLALTAATGDLSLEGGRITGGTITEAGGARLHFGNGYSVFEGAIYQGDLMMTRPGTGNYLRLQNGASFTGDLFLGTSDGNTATLAIEETITLSGKTLNLDPLYGNAYLAIDGDNTLTFASTTTARGAGYIGQAFFVGGTNTLVNQGLISADLNGRWLYINPSLFSNQGDVEAKDGGNVDIQAPDFINLGLLETKAGSALTVSSTTWTNAAGKTIRATGPDAVLNFSGTYTNAGTISLTDATLNLGGTFTTAGVGLGNVVRSGDSRVNVTGTLNNTGGTLVLTAATGDLKLEGGTIAGGTITEAGGAKLDFGSGYGILDGATYQGDLLLNQPGSSRFLRLQNGASFTGDLYLGTPDGNYGVLAFEQTVTLSGKSLNLDPLYSNAYLAVDGDNTITFAPTTSVRGAGYIGQAFFVGGNGTLVNQGIVSADLTAQTLSINPSVFTNQGTVIAKEGAILTIQATNLTNLNATTLTGGTWKAQSSGMLWFSQNEFSINAADLILDGVEAKILVSNFQTPLEDLLASNTAAGALKILGSRSYTTGAFTNAGVIQLGGGAFSPVSLASSGELFGFGSVAIRPGSTGLIRAAGGSLSFANGFQGTGTVQADASAALILDAGPAAGSVADFLILNGSLTLGTKSLSVGRDYTNANFGVGNSFQPRANVSGSGGIQAVGGTGQTIGGNATGGATATPILAFGSGHVGAGSTLGYRIENTGPTGASLRGAIQTTVNGGSLNDSRLSGAGVAAGNFGPITPGGDSGNLAVTFTAATAGALTSQNLRIINNFDNVAGQTLSITGSAYRYAAPNNPAASPVAFGNFHVGDAAPSQVLTVVNQVANDNFSESLNAAIGSPTGGATTNGGSFTGLTPGSSNGSSLAVGISTAAAGLKNGTATLTLTSNGAGSSGLALTALTSQTVDVTGNVYRLASPSLVGGTSLDFGIVHVGETVTKSATVKNAAVADGFSESLNASFSASSGDIVGSGGFTGLASGATSATPQVTLDTATAGAKAGTATLALVSNGTGSSGLANSALASQVITATGQVYNYAAPAFSLVSGPATITGSGSAYTVDFGRRTIGEVVPAVVLRLTNSAAAPADTLAGSFATAAPAFTLTGFDSFTGIAAGQSQGGMSMVLKTDALGTFSQTITLNGLSQNSGGFSGALDPIVITLKAEVAVAPTLTIQLSSTETLLSWPLAEQSWILKRSDNLTTWTTVTAPVVDTATEHTVTVPLTADPKRFFRLEK